MLSISSMLHCTYSTSCSMHCMHCRMCAGSLARSLAQSEMPCHPSGHHRERKRKRLDSRSPLHATCPLSLSASRFSHSHFAFAPFAPFAPLSPFSPFSPFSLHLSHLSLCHLFLSPPRPLSRCLRARPSEALGWGFFAKPILLGIVAPLTPQRVFLIGYREERALPDRVPARLPACLPTCLPIGLPDGHCLSCLVFCLIASQVA